MTKFKIQIKSILGRVLFEYEKENKQPTIRETLIIAVSRGADLEGADLKGAYLEGAYLKGADLEGADLEGADLGLEIPVIENIHQKVYAEASKPHALDMSDWHTCDTTHCQAGWTTILAGEKGRKLEEKVGTATAAYLIYRKSDPSAYALNFYADNKTALENMRALAELEASKNINNEKE